MGVYLNLIINPAGIEAGAWEKVYVESLSLLRAFPFVRLKLEKAGGLPRLVYSTQVEEEDSDGVSRSWLVCGDAKSKKTGEEFSLVRNLQDYRSPAGPGLTGASKRSSARGGQDTGTQDILLVDSGEEDSDNENEKKREINWVTVFGNKTQGYSYHRYVLGLAMLVESRLPGAAVVSGDISLKQAEDAREWANRQLTLPIDLPVRLDADRLWQRLEGHYEGERLLRVFDNLYIRDSAFDVPDIFFVRAPSDDVKSWFKKQLFKFDSLSRVGARRLMVSWLNKSHDLESLCELTLTGDQTEGRKREDPRDGRKCEDRTERRNTPDRADIQDRGRTRFEPEDLIKALTSTWIMIDPGEYEFFGFFENPYGASTSVTSQFGNMYLDSYYAGRKTVVHWEKREVASVLSRHTGLTIEKIEALISEESERQLEKIRHFERLFQPIKEKIDSMQSEEELLDDEDLLLYYSEGTPLKEALKSELSNFARQAVARLSEKEGEDFTQASVEKLHKEIVLWIFHYQLSLTEAGWQWIDAEKDPKVLRLLLTFLRVDNESDRFYRIRQALLENCLFAHHLAEWLADPE